MPAKYQELGPRIVEVPRAKGGLPSQVWEYQGKTYPQIGLNAVAAPIFGVTGVSTESLLFSVYSSFGALTSASLVSRPVAEAFTSAYEQPRSLVL